jgi:hypothetical protein
MSHSPVDITTIEQTLTLLRARIQYSVTQFTLVRVQFPGTLVALLQQALSSHQQAQSLEPENNDVLFNTAQVLSSLVEAVNEDPAQASGLDITTLLEQSIELLRTCLSRQEIQYTEHLKQIASWEAEEGGVSLTASSEDVPSRAGTPSSDADQEQWASVVEPVTAQTLMDTTCALLDTLALSCSLVALNDNKSLDTLYSIASDLFITTIPQYFSAVEPLSQKDIYLSSAHFRSAHLEASYHAHMVTAEEFEQRLASIYNDTSHAPSDVTQSASYLTSYADALIAFNGAFVDTDGNPNTRWKSLTKALDLLTTATKAPDAENVPEIHVGRGDLELLRLVVCKTPGVSGSLSTDKVKATLMKNAQTYYQGAVTIAQASIMLSRAPVVAVAKVKKAVVEGMDGGGVEPLRILMKGEMDKDVVVGVVKDMADEGLITEEEKRAILAK